MEQGSGASDGRRSSLRRSYLSLGLGELAAAVTFAAVAALVVTPRLGGWRETAALWSALTPLLVILVQAGVYWLLARRWVARTGMPSSVASVLRVLRTADVVLLAAGLVGVLVWVPALDGFALAVAGVWLFAVVEYVNYFVVRLAYPLRQWPRAVRQRRVPRLVQDIADAR